MNYFELYAGDYRRDTGRLSLAEHGAYLLLLADVIEIRAAKADASPALVQHLAEKHGCSPQTIRDIWRGDSWGKRVRRKAPARGEAQA